MPRRISRVNRASNDASNTKASPVTPSIEPPILPKHFPFPNVSMESDAFFDYAMAFFAIIAVALQFLNIYKTVWWLPQSYTHSAVHFYLIDPNLIIFIVILFLRHIYYDIGCHLISKLYSNKSQKELSILTRGILFIFFAFVVFISGTIVIGNQPKIYILYLCYPILLYLGLFGFRIRPFFETTTWCSSGIPPIHACSSNPADIRKECDQLKNNFNDRIKQICFTSIINAYYGGLIPFCFAQPHLVVEKYWILAHIFFVFMATAVFSVTHMLSLRYWDVMHRAALHLGMWEKLDPGRNLILVNSEWKDDVLWPGGVLVKHEKGIWRAIGDCNSNIPGDDILNRFYKTCIRPSKLLFEALMIHCFIITIQMGILLFIQKWYKILSLAIIMFFNLYGLYKLFRDYLVSRSFYKPSEDSGDNKDIIDSTLAGVNACDASKTKATSGKRTRTNTEGDKNLDDKVSDEELMNDR